MSKYIFCDYEKLERLKGLQKNVKWKVLAGRRRFLQRLYPLVDCWRCDLPNLRDIFREEEIERLLLDSANLKSDEKDLYSSNEGEGFIDFVGRSGYRHQARFDELGKPLLNRTSPLHQASRAAQELRTIEALFEIYNDFRLNYVDEESGLTHLHVACQYGLDDVAKKFLELGHVDPNCREERTGDSPLHVALRHQRIEVVEMLLSKGADPYLANESGHTYLHVISEIENFYEGVEETLVACLEKKQKEIDAARNEEESTSLHSVLRRELRKMSCINKRYRRDNGLLSTIFEFSVDKSQLSSVNVRDKEGNAPLHLALAKSHRKVVEWLLRRGADPNAANNKGETPLHVVCRRVDVRRYDMNETTSQVDEANLQSRRLPWILENDARYHMQRVVDEFMDIFVHGHRVPINHDNVRFDAWGNNVNATEATDDTALKQSYEEQIVQELLERGAEPHSVDAKGSTPLQLAVANLLPNIVDVILNHVTDLSSFVFPSFSQFDARFKSSKHSRQKLGMASDYLAVVERLEKKGYELNRSDALIIMKLFDKYKMFEELENLDQSWYDDEEFAKEARETMVKPDLSFYDLVHLQPHEASKLLAHSDYLELARSTAMCKLSVRNRKACVARLCETMARKFFRFWALDPFLELIHYRLPIECCEMILENVTNKDLYHICLAAQGQTDKRLRTSVRTNAPKRRKIE